MFLSKRFLLFQSNSRLFHLTYGNKNILQTAEPDYFGIEKIANDNHNGPEVSKPEQNNCDHVVSQTKIGYKKGIENQKLHVRNDKDGYKVYDKQVFDFNKSPKYQVIDELLKSILYQNSDFVAFNKPPGLSTTGDRKSLFSISDIKEDLARALKVPEKTLYLVHRLDKDTSGILLLAKSKDVQEILNNCFSKRLIKKTYWAITVGHANPPNGIIDIPLVSKEYQGRFKMFVLPKDDGEFRPIGSNSHSSSDKKDIVQEHADDTNLELPNQSSKLKNRSPSAGTASIFPAKSEFIQIDKAADVALLKVDSLTGFKHQIRVHLAYGLGIPILGDHKYSHVHEFKPQRLPKRLLEKLHVKQSKVRSIPLHLHAYSLVIPGKYFSHGKYKKSGETSDLTDLTADIVLKARLPFHFYENMHTLGLNKFLN